MSSTTKLLPCPFCSNADIVIKNESPKDNSGGYFIECPGCGASTSLRFACGDDPVPQLAEQWTRRANTHCLHQIQEPAPVQAAQPEDMRDKVTLALGLSLPPKGAPHFAWSYLLGSIRDLVKCEEELVLLKVGKEMSKEIPKAAPAAVAVPDDIRAALSAAVEQIEHDALKIEMEWGTGRNLYGMEIDGDLPPALLQARAALAATQAAAPVVLPEFDLRTSYGARSAVAWYFTNVLQRHDFTKYINNTLAADFACALAPSLLAGVSAPAAMAVEPLDIVQAAADAASVGHLSHLIDHQSQILARAMAAMKAVELTASPIDEPHGDLDARIPYEAWATFVDARAALLHDVAQSPVAAPQAQADCLTCNDHGAVGNILTVEPCPDCTVPAIKAQADARDTRKSGCAESNRYCHARMCLEGDAEHEHDCPAGRAAIAAAKGE